jgi:4'-phosphopantetheinyl transferase EntD
MSGDTAQESPQLAALFPVEVQAAELRGAGNPDTLFPEERAGQEKWAAKRVSEFAAGRQCAHLAMRRLGIAPAPLLSRPDRRPAWPAGVVGSITHCAGFGAAVVARESSVRSLEPHLWPRVLNPHELAWVNSKPESERRLWATVVFSAKEAYYKCQFGVTGNWLEFSDAHVEVGRFKEGQGAFTLVTRSKGVTLHGRGLISERTVCTAFSWPVEK